MSFISLKLVRAVRVSLAPHSTALIALIKPQFEAGRRQVKKGIARDPQIHAAVCDDIAAFVAASGWSVAGVSPRPIPAATAMPSS